MPAQNGVYVTSDMEPRQIAATLQDDFEVSRSSHSYSKPEPDMKSHEEQTAVTNEAVAAFVDSDKLREAIGELGSAGFEPEEFGLLAGEYAVRDVLGEFYEQIHEHEDDADGPSTAFVARKSIGDTLHALLGALFFVGTTGAAGAAVASAAVLGGGLVAAVTGAAAIGAVGAALGLIIHESDAEELEQQIDEGHLLLFVRTRDSAHEQRAVEILQKHTPIEVRIVGAPDRGSENA